MSTPEPSFSLPANSTVQRVFSQWLVSPLILYLPFKLQCPLPWTPFLVPPIQLEPLSFLFHPRSMYSVCHVYWLTSPSHGKIGFPCVQECYHTHLCVFQPSKWHFTRCHRMRFCVCVIEKKPNFRSHTNAVAELAPKTAGS